MDLKDAELHVRTRTKTSSGVQNAVCKKRSRQLLSAMSHLVSQLLDGVLQGQDVAEERTLQRHLQVGQPVTVGPLLPLDQFGPETLQSSQNLLALH